MSGDVRILVNWSAVAQATAKLLWLLARVACCIFTVQVFLLMLLDAARFGRAGQIWPLIIATATNFTVAASFAVAAIALIVGSGLCFQAIVRSHRSGRLDHRRALQMRAEEPFCR